MRALTPPLAAAYGTRLTLRVAIDDTLTIARSLFKHVRQHRVAAPEGREQRTADLGLDLLLVVMLVGLAQMVPPTLLMRMSMRPKCARVRVMTVRQLA